MQPGASWVNRIVGSDVVPAASFAPNPANWRQHPLGQRDAMGGVLGEVGWVGQALVNLRNSPEWGEAAGVATMIDGHLRVAMALDRDPQTPVPRLLVDLTPDEEALVLATFDPISAMATANATLIESLLSGLHTNSEAVSKLLSEVAGNNGFSWGQGGSEHPGPDPAPEPIPPQYLILITCGSEDEQGRLLDRFIEEGISCKALIS